jgi:hypothetical protein
MIIDWQEWVWVNSRQMRELLRRMAFNILIDNTDDHEKNHALLMTDAATYELSPAYDVLPSGQGLGFQQMRVGVDAGDSTLDNALSMSAQSGSNPRPQSKNYEPSPAPSRAGASTSPASECARMTSSYSASTSTAHFCATNARRTQGESGEQLEQEWVKARAWVQGQGLGQEVKWRESGAGGKERNARRGASLTSHIPLSHSSPVARHLER